MFDKPFLITLAVFAGLSFFPLAQPTFSRIDEAKDVRFETIPYQIGSWTGKDEVLDEQTYEILETRNILSRLYQNPNNKGTVYLLLVSSSKDRRVAHPPEVCFTSSHYDLTSSKDAVFEIGGEKIPVKEFVAEDQNNPTHKEHVLYVYQVGDRFTSNYYAQQLQFTMDSLAKKDSRVLLIRLSASSEDSFQQFLSEILPHIKSS